MTKATGPVADFIALLVTAIGGAQILTGSHGVVETTFYLFMVIGGIYWMILYGLSWVKL